MSAIWEVRNDLVPAPGRARNSSQLDTVRRPVISAGSTSALGVLGAIGAGLADRRGRAGLYRRSSRCPTLKLPRVRPGDRASSRTTTKFAQRLKVAFQSFIGLGQPRRRGAQSKAPPLELGRTARVRRRHDRHRRTSWPPMPAPGAKEPVHQRQNFSPSAAQVDNHFIISSSLGLTKDLIPVLRKPAKETDVTAIIEADGPTLAHLLGDEPAATCDPEHAREGQRQGHRERPDRPAARTCSNMPAADRSRPGTARRPSNSTWTSPSGRSDASHRRPPHPNPPHEGEENQNIVLTFPCEGRRGWWSRLQGRPPFPEGSSP